MTDHEPEVPEWFSTKEVAGIFCVSVPTVRSWRTPAYADSPLRLVGERTAHNQYRYHIDALEAFVELNPRFHPFLASTLRRGTPVLHISETIRQLRLPANEVPAAAHGVSLDDLWQSFGSSFKHDNTQLETNIQKDNPL